MSPSEKPRVSTGLSGLDDILCGGLDPDCLYLVEGRPGTCKTTLGLHFLLDGIKRGEKGLYITLSESETELRLVAARHGWSLGNVDIFQLVPCQISTVPVLCFRGFDQREKPCVLRSWARVESVASSGDDSHLPVRTFCSLHAEHTCGLCRRLV